MSVANHLKVQQWSAWQTALFAIGLSTIVLLVLYRDTFWSMVVIWWRTGTYSHGFIIFPTVAYLIWMKREGLKEFIPRPAGIALVLATAMVMLWVAGDFLNVQLLRHLSVISMLPILTWLLLGGEIVRFLAFPLMFMFFAVPAGEFLVPELQDITAGLTTQALQLSSIPVYMEGRYFYIPSGSFEVARECSGVRYLIASICLGSLYAYFSFRSIKKRVLFIAFCSVLPIFGNAGRAYVIVMLAHLSGYKLAVGVDHFIYGWVFFAVLLLITFWIGSYFRDSEDKPPRVQGVDNNKIVASKNRFFVWMVLAIITMGAGTAVAGWLDLNRASVPAELSLLPGKNNWEGPAQVEPVWKPVYKGASREQLVKYDLDGGNVTVYVAYYAEQNQDLELINSENVPYNNDVWKRSAEQGVTINYGNESLDVNEVRISSQNENRLLWQWYEIGTHKTSNAFFAKLYEVPKAMFKEKSGSLVIVLSAKYDLDSQVAHKLLQRFVRDMAPIVKIKTKTNI